MTDINKHSFTIDFRSAITKDILGVGVEWDPPQYPELPPFADEQWELIFKRMDFFKLGFARVMVYSPLANIGTSAADNDYESDRVKNLCRTLDYCQNNGVTVMLGIWNKPEAIEEYDDPVFIRSVVDYLEYLYDKKGYTCIKYFNFINEPNGDWEIPYNNWLRWKAGVTALHEELSTRHTLRHLKICGPDSAYDDEWVDMCVAALPHVIGDYEYHIYLHDKTEIIENKLERMLRKKRKAVSENDPDGKEKKLWLGEFGCRDGKWDEATDCQNSVYDFIYGVWIADAVIQAFRAGLSGIIPWDMDDAAHPAANTGKEDGTFKRWGFWNSYGGRTIQGTRRATSYPKEDLEIRPWFYPMSLFSRLFPKGGTVLNTGDISASGIKVCAMKLPNERDFTFVVLNTNECEKKVNLNCINGPDGIFNLNKYVYFENDRPSDEDGFATVKEVLSDIELAKGLDLVLPGKGVVFISTLK